MGLFFLTNVVRSTFPPLRGLVTPAVFVIVMEVEVSIQEHLPSLMYSSPAMLTCLHSSSMRWTVRRGQSAWQALVAHFSTICSTNKGTERVAVELLAEQQDTHNSQHCCKYRHESWNKTTPYHNGYREFP